MARKTNKRNGKFTKAEEKKASKIAEELKGKKGIKSPFAVAAAAVKRGRRK